MSGTINLTSESFAATVEKGTVLVDFWAPWCGPCRAFGPIYERVAARFPGVVFAKVNTEDEPELAGRFQITAIPTLMVLKDGATFYSQAGMLPERSLVALVEQALAGGSDGPAGGGRLSDAAS